MKRLLFLLALAMTFFTGSCQTLKFSDLQTYLGYGDSTFVPVVLELSPGVFTNRKMYATDLAHGKLDSLKISNDSLYAYNAGSKRFVGKVNQGTGGGGTGVANAFSTFTDGTNSAVASGATSLRFRSADNLLSIFISNSDVTYGRNALFTLNQGNLVLGMGQITGLNTALASKANTATTLAGYGITDAASAGHTHTFSSITSKPTTLSGYGITDAASITHTHAATDIIQDGTHRFIQDAERTLWNTGYVDISNTADSLGVIFTHANGVKDTLKSKALGANFVDSLKRSTDSVFAHKNGLWSFQYKDSVGAGGGSITVPGANSNVIYNNSGALGANANFNYNVANNRLELTSTGIALRIFNNPSAYAGFQVDASNDLQITYLGNAIYNFGHQGQLQFLSGTGSAQFDFGYVPANGPMFYLAETNVAFRLGIFRGTGDVLIGNSNNNPDAKLKVNGSFHNTGRVTLDSLNDASGIARKVTSTNGVIGFTTDFNATNLVYNEVPTGTVNGSNTTFTLAATPVTGKVKVYQNGLRLKPTTDFTVSGATVTFTTAPPNGAILLIDYIK